MKEKVLIVDDDPDTLDIIKGNILKNVKSIEVFTAANTQHALEILQTTTDFLAIIIDGLHGDWLKVAQKAQELRITHITIFSANLNYVQEAKEQGFSAYHKGSFSFRNSAQLVGKKI